MQGLKRHIIMRPRSAPRRSFRLFLAVLTITLLASACTSNDGEQGDRANPDETTGQQGTSDTGESGDPVGGETDGSGAEDPSGSDTTSTTEGQAMTVRTDGGEPTSETVVTIDLSETTERPADDLNSSRTVSGDALGDPARDSLLDRLDAIEIAAGDQVEYARPTDTRPPPRPLTIVDAAFPPAPSDASAPEPAAGPLEVLRFQPEGEVDTAPFISVSFNKPMVPVGTIDQVDAAAVPITVEPAIEGRWIWLGTRTVRFEHENDSLDRLPKATKYVVNIPAGSQADDGSTLAEAVEFTFATPPARVTAISPLSDSLPTNGLFLVEFNQRVDATVALNSIDVTANGVPEPTRLATDEEIANDAAINLATSRLLEDRWLVFRAVDKLPTNAFVEIVAQSVPSAEGPLLSDVPARFSGRTYARFEFRESRCAWGGDQCQPGSPLLMQFSNPINTEEFDPSLITVNPPLPGAQIGVQYDSIVVRGATVGRTEYTVTVGAGLLDVFEQQLAEDAQATFTIGDAEPSLLFPGTNLITLDPIINDGTYTLSSINHEDLDLLVYEVDPLTDWIQFQENSWQLGTDRANVDWRLLAETTITPPDTPNAWVKTPIDLNEHLTGTGHVVMAITPTSTALEEWQRQPLALWVQRTDLGIDAYSTEFDRLIRVTSLSDGEPITGATITPIGDNGSALATSATNSDGIVVNNDQGLTRTLVASHEDDSAIIGDFWSQLSEPRPQTRWYVIDDRGLYKPGETAHVKGFVRVASVVEPAALRLPDAATSIRWTARDAFGNDFDEGTIQLGDVGGFDLTIDIPDDITPGPAGIEFMIRRSNNDQGAFHYHQLQVQEFRRPDFEVAVEAASAGPYLINETAQLLAEADYFATGPLAAAEVQWTVQARAGSYSPPGWTDFTFGIWQPWWFGGQFSDDGGFGRGPGRLGNTLATERLISTTDAAGEHGLGLSVAVDGKPRPLSLSAAATVIDVNRQAISGSTDLLVHPSSIYVGLRSERSFVQSGEDLTIDVITSTIDGDQVSGQDVTVDLIRNTWQFTNGIWAQVDDLTDSCEVTTGDEPTSCTFQPELGGSYRVAATVVDEQGRTNLTELTRWVAGESRPASPRVAREDVTIIPQGELFAPGDSAELLLQSPFTDAHGLLVITRGSISSHEIINFDESGAAVVQVPISEDDIPAIGIHVEVVGTAPRGESVRPAYASGQLTLDVSSESRRLTVTASPAADATTPGSTTSLDVLVINTDGDPVADAELAVIVVDEAVLSLTNYELRDPLSAFYQRAGGWLQAQRGRSTLILSEPEVLFSPELAATGGDESEDAMSDDGGGAPIPQAALADDGGGSLARSEPQLELAGTAPAGPARDAPIGLRTNFDALAVFEPDVATGNDGRATIDVPLPDNLTRYRIMVIAASGAQLAGSGESNLTARLPISVRPTAPRFANFGDVFEFPVVVQNATDQDRSIDVAVRATNLLVADRDAVTVTVPANDRVEVRFDMQADQAGVARFQVVAASGDMTDAAEGSFPVYTPATSEAFATYGIVDSGSVGQNVVAPADVFAQFGGLEISTSSTAVSSLTDAVISLNNHRYQNADALASRIVAIISLDSILTAFESPDLSPAELNSTVNSDVERLLAMQNPDGGFNWWRRNGPSIPWVTVSATHALVLADQDGRDVSAAKLAAALELVSRIETIFPNWYSEDTKTAVRAYALYVENLADVDVRDRATALYREKASDLSPDVAAWLWPALADDAEISAEIERQLNNRVTETANAATFTTSYGEQDWLLLHSDRRTDAIVLDALLDQAPDSDLVIKTLNGLLAARGQGGAWRNVQENSWVLIAASHYFEQFEVDDPSFVARAWLGDTYTLAHEHLGRRSEQDRTIVPMHAVIDGGDQQLVIDKDGDGRLYYRIGLRYAPTDLVLAPRDRGFVVQRSYEPVDDENDVTQNEDGSWTIVAGSRVRISVSMVADSRRTHVALIDPLPAGLEAINPVFTTSEPVLIDPGNERSPFTSWYRWFNHQNLRDDRAEAFTTWLGAGTYEYSYVARATIPGTFVVPPARAEQLYEPEVFGRSASTTVTVIDQ